MREPCADATCGMRRADRGGAGRVNERFGAASAAHRMSGFTAVLEVDRDGLVIDYEMLFRRLPDDAR